MFYVDMTIGSSSELRYLKLVGIGPDGLSITDDTGPDGNGVPVEAEVSTFSTCASSGTSRLKDAVWKYSPHTITWSYRLSPNVSPREWGPSVPLGNSSITLYLSLDDPLTPPTQAIYRSVAENACKIGGATSVQSAVANTWAAFSSRTVKSWGGRTLFYYKTGTTLSGDPDQNPDSVSGLLANPSASGNCHAWRDFMLECLAVHGAIPAVPVVVTLSTLGEVAFLVKQWSENPSVLLQSLQSLSSPSYKWTLSFPTSGKRGEMFPGGPTYGDLKSDSGIPGQGSGSGSPSEKIFGKHWILKYNTTYYDPSYGTTYSSAADMVSKGVYGFCINHQVTSLKARPSGSGGLVFTDEQ